ncbi:MAG: ThiF family adenylyltransferase [Succinivibrionaceae bacterium]
MCVDKDDQLARFRGIASLFGIKSLEKLRESSVSIVGIGGVGSWCVESLVRSGVGNIRIFDHDTIAIHNINRQCHSLSSTIGKQKVTVFKERLLDINPDLNIEFFTDFITEDNLDKFFPKEMSKNVWVVDAIDSIDSKTALVNYLKRNKFKFITSGGAGGKSDPTKIKIGDLSFTTHDALLKNLRLKLKKEYGFTTSANRKMGIKCVYLEQSPVYPKNCNNEEELNRLAPLFDNSHITFGAFMSATATVGLTIAQQIILGILK